MIKFKIFGYKITIEKEFEKQEKAIRTKINNSVLKIKNALKEMNKKQIKYSEYALQKESALSINTIKKYRSEIANMRSENKS